MGLPFAEEHFQVVIASLCLHYFPWAQTQKIVTAIRDRLKAGGVLLARVNSVSDPQFAAASGENLERNCRVIDGVFKRYFDQHDLLMLFRKGWMVQSMEEKLIQRYNRDKVLWEIAAQVR
jgi:SAM-dependent methyltransferase